MDHEPTARSIATRSPGQMRIAPRLDLRCRIAVIGPTSRQASRVIPIAMDLPAGPNVGSWGRKRPKNKLDQGLKLRLKMTWVCENSERAFTEGNRVLPAPRFPRCLATARDDIDAREEGHSMRSACPSVLTRPRPKADVSKQPSPLRAHARRHRRCQRYAPSADRS